MRGPMSRWARLVHAGRPVVSESKARRAGSVQHITVLMRACQAGHEGIVACLLDARASQVQCDSRGWNALCYALGAGEVGVARRFCELIDRSNVCGQKQVAVKLREEVVAKCKEAGQEAAELLNQAYDSPSGFLHSVAYGSQAHSVGNGSRKVSRGKELAMPVPGG